MKKYDREHSFFYLDPPYYETAGYGVEFPFSEYEVMADVMRNLKGKAMLSINDHPEIRRVFAGLHMESLDIKYTVGGGARAADRKELVIWSWDPATDQDCLF